VHGYTPEPRKSFKQKTGKLLGWGADAPVCAPLLQIVLPHKFKPLWLAIDCREVAETKKNADIYSSFSFRILLPKRFPETNKAKQQPMIKPRTACEADLNIESSCLDKSQ
jgi:hypothetical protein